MKIKILFVLVIIIFPVLGFSATHALPVIYVVQQAPSKNTWQISVNHPTDETPSLLALRRSVSGVASQVEAVNCDGKPLSETQPGAWLVPTHCKTLQWNVTFIDASNTVAAKQQSMQSGGFKLLSEASSLPRLLNANGEDELKIDLPYHTVFPKVNYQGYIPLSPRTSPPLFLLVNAAPLHRLTSNDIRLNYWVDHASDKNKIPDEHAEMSGLQWLNQLMANHTKLTFSVAWLGLPKELLSMGGATGSDILLTNYSNDGDITFGKSMMLYIALHESFHEFSEVYGRQPVWAAESLASYFGARATVAALPQDETSKALMQHFMDAGLQFNDGLLTVNEKVGEGDQSEYSAFYTKGIAFWDALDKAMQVQGDGLDHHLVDLLRLKYDKAGNPINLQAVCHLSPNVYAALSKQYLS